MKKRVLASVILLLAASLGGCASMEPRVYEVRSAPLPLLQASVRLDQIADAIMRAGTSLGWQMRRTGAHDITGILDVYHAEAVVGVHFTTRSYTIQYRRSRHLHAAAGHIESRYNIWVKSLSQQIEFQAACIGRIQCRQAI
ncbi:MAG: hypothetical protein ACYDDA_08315 [Acidiferrobacteraceae bacterium]